MNFEITPIVAEMSGFGLWVSIVVITFVVLVIFALLSANLADIEKKQKLAAMGSEELAEYEETERLRLAESKWGKSSVKMICPHCQTTGTIRTMQIDTTTGISGAKATGAILTGGVSMLATGLSQKKQVTQAHCETCSSTWSF